MAKKASWYTKGKAGRERSRREDEAAKQRREQSGVWRFRLQNNESCKIVFLDNPDFFIHEHTLKMGPKNFVNETCIKDYGNCAPCDDMGDISSFELIGTIIDTRPYTNSKGETIKTQKRLFVAKGKARQILIRRIEQNDDNLQYCVFEVARGSQPNECATGEDLVFLKRLKKSQVKKLIPPGEKEEWLEPFDYEKIFKPKTDAELRKLYGSGGPAVGGEDDDIATKDEDEDVEDMLSGGSDDSGGEEEEENEENEFDEDALIEELEDKSRKGLEKFIKAEELDVKFTKRTKDATLIKKIVEAMREASEEEEEEEAEAEEVEETKDDGDIDIDDLI
jgi:hypothetical protein